MPNPNGTASARSCLGGRPIAPGRPEAREIGSRTRRRIGVTATRQLDTDEKVRVLRGQTREPHHFGEKFVAFVSGCDEFANDFGLLGAPNACSMSIAVTLRSVGTAWAAERGSGALVENRVDPAGGKTRRQTWTQ
jgi:hypothetical protein